MLNNNNINFGLLNQTVPFNPNPQNSLLANTFSKLGQNMPSQSNAQSNNLSGLLMQALSSQANNQTQESQLDQNKNVSDLKPIFQDASEQTGIPEDYLSAVAKRESGMNPDAKATGSSATGLFQFLPSTWANMVQKYGNKFGIGLDDMHDPKAQTIMAAQLAKDNSSALKMGLGINPTNTDLYMAHFLGAKGALGFLKANFINPDASVTDVVPPNAIAANKSVFLNKDGTPKTVSQVYDSIESSIG